jgi:hypothetical protein
MLSKEYQLLTFPFLSEKKRQIFRDYILITSTHSLCWVIIHDPLSLSSSPVFPYLCSFSFSLQLVACSFFNHLGITYKPWSSFFSHIQAVHPTHFKILLFLPVPVLKSCQFLCILKPKNLIIISLSTAKCSPHNFFYA